jgi:hypothetical protein
MFRTQIIEKNGKQILLQYIFSASFKVFRIIKQRQVYALQSPKSRGVGLVLKKYFQNPKLSALIVLYLHAR